MRRIKLQYDCKILYGSVDFLELLFSTAHNEVGSHVALIAVQDAVAVFDGLFVEFLFHEAGGPDEECLLMGRVDGKLGSADTNEVVNINFMAEKM